MLLSTAVVWRLIQQVDLCMRSLAMTADKAQGPVASTVRANGSARRKGRWSRGCWESRHERFCRWTVARQCISQSAVYLCDASELSRDFCSSVHFLFSPLRQCAVVTSQHFLSCSLTYLFVTNERIICAKCRDSCAPSCHPQKSSGSSEEPETMDLKR